MGNEAGIGLHGVAEPVIWKVKCPAASEARVCPLVTTCHLLHHGGDPVTTVGPSGKKCRNPQKSISRNGTTPRNIPGKEVKMMVCFGWQMHPNVLTTSEVFQMLS